MVLDLIFWYRFETNLSLNNQITGEEHWALSWLNTTSGGEVIGKVVATGGEPAYCLPGPGPWLLSAFQA